MRYIYDTDFAKHCGAKRSYVGYMRYIHIWIILKINSAYCRGLLLVLDHLFFLK